MSHCVEGYFRKELNFFGVGSMVSEQLAGV
jgi:hypothetical protein